MSSNGTREHRNSNARPDHGSTPPMIHLLWLLPLLANSFALRRRKTSTNPTPIEQIVAREQLKVTNPPLPTPLSVYDPSDCLVRTKDAVDEVTNLGNQLVQRRNFHASHDCFKNALQSWFAGVQSSGYADRTGKKKPNMQHLNSAIEQLQFQTLPGAMQDRIGRSKDGPIDRPQIPPQLLYEHQLKQQQEQEQEEKEKGQIPVHSEGNTESIVVPPKMVQERDRKRTAQKSTPPVAQQDAKVYPAVSSLKKVQVHKPETLLAPEQELRKLALQTIANHGRVDDDRTRISQQQYLGPYRL